MMEREWRLQCAETNGTPVEESPYNLVVPRSACPHCKHAISALENIPVLSYLFQRGRCKGCQAPISIRYPLVEIATGLLAATCGLKFGATFIALVAFGFCAALVALTFIDLDTFLLPDSITLPLIWAGLLFNLFSAPNGFTSLSSSVLGAAAGYRLFLCVLRRVGFANGGGLGLPGHPAHEGEVNRSQQNRHLPCP